MGCIKNIAVSPTPTTDPTLFRPACTLSFRLLCLLRECQIHRLHRNSLESLARQELLLVVYAFFPGRKAHAQRSHGGMNGPSNGDRVLYTCDRADSAET